MTTMTDTASGPSPMGWFSKGEAWLDSKGKGAWIATMVLGFIFFWPVGLAVLAYMIWSKRMFSKSCRSNGRHSHWKQRHYGMHSTTGNRAFDAYKADTLRRLEEEQRDFESFLERLREAKDKAEFDEFIDERAKKAAESHGDDEAA